MGSRHWRVNRACTAAESNDAGVTTYQFQVTAGPVTPQLHLIQRREAAALVELGHLGLRLRALDHVLLQLLVGLTELSNDLEGRV